MRKIIHIDMDAFYASVEQRDNPSLQGKPVIVGGKPNSRSVVCTASYEARKYGIHSAMPCSQAYRRCPHAIFVQPNFSKYKVVSEQVQQVFREITELVQPLSLDEAYLDVTGVTLCKGSATMMAREICKQIFNQTGLTASAGVSFNNFLAKIASDINKPNGIFVIRPEHAQDFIDTLPVERFHGIGKASRSKLHALSIKTGKDLRQAPREMLLKALGKRGERYQDLANGIDCRQVIPDRIKKSIGREETFTKNITSRAELIKTLCEQGSFSWNSTVKQNLTAKTITIKVKYHNFKQFTRSKSFDSIIHDFKSCEPWIDLLVKKEFEEEVIEAVRLSGVTFSQFAVEESSQQSFW